MSFTLDLGTNFPYADGTITSDVSRYLGNNTFLRVISQTNNNKIMAGLYTVDDPYSASPTITTVHEQILDDTLTLYNTRILQLGNGSFFLSYNKGMNARPSYTIFKYDELIGEFVVEALDQPYYYDTSDAAYISFAKFLVSSQYIETGRYVNYSVFPYGEKSLIYVASEDGVSDKLNIGIIRDVYGTDTATRNSYEIYSFSVSFINAFYPDYTNFYQFGDKVVITLSNNASTSNIVLDMSTESRIYDSSNSTDIAQLDTDRFLKTSSYQGNSEIRYSLVSSISDTQVANIKLSPNITFPYSVQTHRATLPLDRFHAIHFRASNSNLYAFVMKVMDENYAYVSDASANGILVTSNSIFNFSSTQKRMERFSCMIDGQWLKRIDETRFYIQTGYNEFTFFEISPTPAS